MGTRKIAIIEDDPASRMLVHAILEALYEVIDYESGSDALEGLGTDKPDLVLLDVSLPKEGTEALEKIRADETMRDCPVIALTTDALTGNRDELIVSSEDEVTAYAPKTGRTLWTVTGNTFEVIPTPTVAHGLVFCSSGRAGPTLAIRPGGKGDVTDTHVAWRAMRLLDSPPHVLQAVLRRLML